MGKGPTDDRIDPRDRFTEGVQEYGAHRPDYPGALFRWILDETAVAPDEVIIDIGCGTGISTRQLAALGVRVVGVDPNPAMLDTARDERPPTGAPAIRWLVGDAESFTLPSWLCSAPIGAIVGGQCFHWFGLDRALPHLAALAPGRRIVAFWNLRDETDPLMAEYERLLLERCDEYACVGAEVRASALCAHPLVRNVRSAEFAGHRQSLDLDGFIGRVWSSSYVRRSIATSARGDFDAALRRLFDAHARDGRVDFVYRAVAHAFSVDSPN